MSRYRKVDSRIWNDAKFTSMGDDGKLVFFLLLTHPSMTALGAMRATLPGLAAELKWTPEAFAKAFREASSKGMAEHDENASMIALPNFLKYNQPESPNVVKAWVGAFDLLPECALKARVIARAQACAGQMSEGFSKAFREAFREALPKRLPYQEQEQEQEQEQDLKENSSTDPVRDPAGSSKPGAKVQPITKPGDSVCDIVLKAYHQSLPNCQAVQVLTPKRRRRIVAADKLAGAVCREQGWQMQRQDFWLAYFGECAADPWLRGDVPNPKNVNWHQNLEVLIAEDRFAAIMDKAIAGQQQSGDRAA